MKKTLLTLAAVCFAFSMYAKDIQELVVTTTPPMSCQNCENKIKKNIRFEKGVKNIETNLAEQRVTIEYDAEKTNPEKIEEAFTKIGYHVEVIDSQNPQSNPESSCPNASGCGKPEGACCKNSQK